MTRILEINNIDDLDTFRESWSDTDAKQSQRECETVLQSSTAWHSPE